MPSILKKSSAVAASALLLYVAYYGSYLPLQKSQSFINALRNLPQIKSVADFDSNFSAPLDANSPIGQEELVRNTANTVLGLIQQQGTGEAVSRELASYAQKYYAPIVARGRGMSFEQNLYLLGAINEIMFFRFHDPQYLQAADNYYSEGRGLGPERPQFLYGLFDVYRAEGNVSEVETVARQILSQWPTDQNTKEALASFLEQVQSRAR